MRWGVGKGSFYPPKRKGPGAFFAFFPASPINPAFYKVAPKRCKAQAKTTTKWVAQTGHWRVMQPQPAQGQVHKPRQPGGRAVAKIRFGWGADGQWDGV